MEFCPECGTKNDAFSASCTNCGAPLANAPAKSLDQPVSAPSSVASTIFCGGCGAKNQSGTSFCGSCGKSISGMGQPAPQHQLSSQSYQAQSSFSTQSQSPNQGYQQGYQPGYQQPSSQGYYSSGRAPPNFFHPGKKSVALAVLVSFIIPGFAYMYTDRIGQGILFFIITWVTYGFGIGLLIHIYMIYAGKKEVDAYNYNLFMMSQGQRY